MALGKNIKQKEINLPQSDVATEISGEKSELDTTGTISLEKNISEEIIEETIKQSQYCVFSSGKEEYAIPISVVKEVVKYKHPAPIPQMPEYIIGMSNIRGNIYGIMDIDIFFHAQNRQGQDHKYLLVIDHEEYKMAIRIFDVPNSMMVEDSKIEQFNASTSKSVIGQKYLKGIIKKDDRMIVLFDILGMISSEKFTELAL